MSWKLLKIPPVEGFQTYKETADLFIPVSSLREGEQREIDNTAIDGGQRERGYYFIYTAGDCYVNVKLACTSARQQKLSLLQGCILPIHLEQDLNNIA
jgi:flavin-dependent dehydrogenase